MIRYSQLSVALFESYTREIQRVDSHRSFPKSTCFGPLYSKLSDVSNDKTYHLYHHLPRVTFHLLQWILHYNLTSLKHFYLLRFHSTSTKGPICSPRVDSLCLINSTLFIALRSFKTSSRTRNNKKKKKKWDMVKAGADLQFPPGFRFHPTDEELVLMYLCRKCASQPIAAPIITELDLYRYDAWDLPGTFLFTF